jgi:hypothetical protein
MLRRLDRSQMHELARRAGFERAEGFLERLAREKGRLTPSLLLQIVQRIKNVDAGEVDDLVRGLRDPDRREELLREGLESVGSLLDEGETADADREPAESPPTQAEPPPTPVVAPKTISVAAPVRVTTVPSTPPPATAKPRRPEPAAVREPFAASASEPPTTAPAPAAPRSSTPVREQYESTDRDLDDLVGGLTRASTTLHRLKLLRRELARIGKLDVEDLRRLLDTFPAGWARRRALTTLLRAGVPGTLMHAVFLIEQLESPTARRWCAAALVDRRSLTPAEREALIERHGLFPHRRQAL